MTVNSMSFTPKDVANGEFQKFLMMLTTMELEDRYNDIHVWSDSYCIIVEWVSRDYNDYYGIGEFKFVDKDHEVVPIEEEQDNDT